MKPGGRDIQLTGTSSGSDGAVLDMDLRDGAGLGWAGGASYKYLSDWDPWRSGRQIFVMVEVAVFDLPAPQNQLPRGSE